MLHKNPAFETQEYRRRLGRVKERMDEAGIEVLLTVDPANMNYLTGYDGWSFYVHQGVIVIREQDDPIWFGREQDANGARITTFMPDECVYGYPDTYVQATHTHTMVYVSELLAELGVAERPLGVELDNFYFSARMLRELHRCLPNTVIIDATALVNWVKTVKSPIEIAYMRQAARICERVMQTAIDSIEVGSAEKDACAEVVAAQIAGTEQFGGESPAIFPIMPSAERTSTAHLTFNPDRRYQANDVVLLELCGVRRRYHVPLSRTVYLGDPPDDLKRTADTVVSGLQRTLEFIRPGVTAEDVEAAWRNCLRGTGVEKPSRVGYSFGLSYVPDWGERTISLRPGDATVLEPGMTLHFMPGIWLERYGFECSEPVLITENGCEKFVEFPQQLFSDERDS